METTQLTMSSADDEAIRLPQNLSERASRDLSGSHEAEVCAIYSNKSKHGERYQTVAAKILSGPGEGEIVYGPVFQNNSLERFILALGHDPSQIGDRLMKNQVIGKRVRIVVEPEDREGPGGITVKEWVIRKFAPLT